ncbi:hypothetical protein [Microbacterium sp. NPDC056569]|uniref:hypothetical protein n=1 Tax=Microbacterium sp. NPDC056569 TaxID=3345867 RepID=UPI00366E20D0
MPHTTPSRLVAAATAIIAVAALLTGCSSVTRPPALTIAATATSAEFAPQIDAVRDQVIEHAQDALLPGDGIVNVVGPDSIEEIDLTPMRGDDVEYDAVKAAKKLEENLEVLTGAVGDLAATAEGLDSIGLLDRALSLTPANGTVVLITSGLSTVAPLDLTQAGDWISNPGALVDATDLASLPTATGRHLLFVGLGQAYSDSGQPSAGPAARAALTSIYLGICARMDALSCRALPSVAGSSAPLAVNDVPLLEFDPVATACVRTLTVDASFAFGGDSAVLEPAADAILGPIADALAECATTGAIDATGYSADVDCDHDPTDAAGLEFNRAHAVLIRLEQLGAPRGSIGDAAAGGHLIDDCPAGHFVEDLGRSNRVVVLTARD